MIENQRHNHELTIQRRRQHYAHKTQDKGEQTQIKKTWKLKNMSNMDSTKMADNAVQLSLHSKHFETLVFFCYSMYIIKYSNYYIDLYFLCKNNPLKSYIFFLVLYDIKVLNCNAFQNMNCVVVPWEINLFIYSTFILNDLRSKQLSSVVI